MKRPIIFIRIGMLNFSYFRACSLFKYVAHLKVLKFIFCASFIALLISLSKNLSAQALFKVNFITYAFLTTVINHI